MAAGVDSILTRLTSTGAGQVIADLNRVAEAQKRLADQAGKTDAALGASMERLQKVGGTASTVGNAFGAMAVGAGAAVGWALKLAGGLEQARIGFTTLLGDAKKADGFIRDLQKFAATTPFEFTGLQKAASQMLAFGFTTKEILPNLRVIGDAVSALGGGPETLERVIRAFGQIKVKGRLGQEEINQLTEAGIGAPLMLQKQGILKKGVDVGRQGPSGRGVEADVAIAGLLRGMQEQFGGGMEAQSKTMLGQLSNLKDAVDQFGGALGGEFVPDATKFISKLTEMINVSKSGDGRLAHTVATWMKWGVVIGGAGLIAGKFFKLYADFALIRLAKSARNITANLAEAASAKAMAGAYTQAAVASGAVGGRGALGLVTSTLGGTVGRLPIKDIMGSATGAAAVAGKASIGTSILAMLPRLGGVAAGGGAAYLAYNEYKAQREGKHEMWKGLGFWGGLLGATGGGALAGGLFGGFQPLAIAIGGLAGAVAYLAAALLGSKTREGVMRQNNANAVVGVIKQFYQDLRASYEQGAEAGTKRMGSAASSFDLALNRGYMLPMGGAGGWRPGINMDRASDWGNTSLWSRMSQQFVRGDRATMLKQTVGQFDNAMQSVIENLRARRDLTGGGPQMLEPGAYYSGDPQDAMKAMQEWLTWDAKLQEAISKYIQQREDMLDKFSAWAKEQDAFALDQIDVAMAGIESGQGTGDMAALRASRRRLTVDLARLNSIRGNTADAWKLMAGLSSREWQENRDDTRTLLEQRSQQADRALSYISSGLLGEQYKPAALAARASANADTYGFLMGGGTQGRAAGSLLAEQVAKQAIEERQTEDARHLSALMSQYDLAKKVDDLAGSDKRKFLEASQALGMSAPQGAKAIKEQILQAAKGMYQYLLGIGAVTKANEFARDMQGFLLQDATKRQPNLAREIIATGGLSGLTEAYTSQNIGDSLNSIGWGKFPLRGRYRIGEAQLLSGTRADRIRATGAKEGEKKARLDIYGHGDDEWGQHIVEMAIDGFVKVAPQLFSARVGGMQTVTP